MIQQHAERTIVPATPSCKTRLLAAGFYLGAAPLGLWAPACRRNTFLVAHRNQALALFALLGTVLLTALVLVALLSLGMVYHRALVERWPAEAWLISLCRKLLIVWAVFWAYGVVRAIRGRVEPVPFLFRLNNHRGVRLTGAVAVFMGLFFIMIFSVTLHVADNLVIDNGAQGRVYMVYDNPQRMPKAFFSFAMLPITREAHRKWGPGSVKLLPMTRDDILHALSEGAFVFIASHGTEQGLLLESGYFKPEDIPDLQENNTLAFVYLAGCDSGAQGEAWENALFPAQVKTYDRMTPVIEHLWWSWVRGPKIVRQLP